MKIKIADDDMFLSNTKNVKIRTLKTKNVGNF